MTTYTVHLYREMCVVFREIEAASHWEAAHIASDMPTDEAESIDDCDGDSFSATVEREEPDDYEERPVRLRADGGEIEPAPAIVTNAHRAAWAEAALAVLMQHTGCDRSDALGDLLCDLMHWAVVERFDLAAALDRALGHFEAELVEEGRMPPPPPHAPCRRFELAVSPLLDTLNCLLSPENAPDDAEPRPTARSSA